MEMLAGSTGDVKAQSRKPEIVGDAAYVILTRDSRSYTGKFAIDEEVLKGQGVQDFNAYNYVESEMAHDFLSHAHTHVL
jgi:hypothetical protein